MPSKASYVGGGGRKPHDALAGVDGPTVRLVNDADLAFAGIAEQARLLEERTVTSVDLVETYLERIQRIDPELNAFREVYGPEALAEAAKADRRLSSGEALPLLGVPVAIKDELDITGRITSHGTVAYGEPARSDAEHVRRLRNAGAIVIGKTNLPELAITGFTESEFIGDTRNPWDTSRTPGGSSGGSGAAVAAGLVGAASASDGAGSIRIPAANCGLFGLKPQRGRISLMPESEHWFGMSMAGCLTRRVLDAALWLDVAAGPAPGDAHTPPLPRSSFFEAASTPPPQLTVAWSLEPVRALAPPIVGESARIAVDTVVAALAKLGHSVVARTPEYGAVGNEIAPLYLRGILQHFEQVPHPERLEARTRGFARMGRLVPEAMARGALDRQVAHTERINRIFDEVDLLVTPATGLPPLPVGEWRGKGAVRTSIGMSRVYPYTAVWNYTGQPAATVPAGFTADGLPIGAMLIAPPNREELLLSVAAQLEHALGWIDHRPPGR